MGLPPQWNDNGEHLTRASANRHNLPTILDGLHGMTIEELQALPPAAREDYSRISVDGRDYVWNGNSTLTGDDQLVVAPADGSDGRWLLAPKQTAQLSLPFSWETADATALFTIPTGGLIVLRDLLWNITEDMTGGVGSAIGVSSDHAGYTTQGDLLGGATGDVAATLTAAGSPTFGTIGAQWTTLTLRQLILEPGEIVRFDQITSAFTAGSGYVELLCYVLANDGA